MGEVKGDIGDKTTENDRSFACAMTVMTAQQKKDVFCQNRAKIDGFTT